MSDFKSLIPYILSSLYDDVASDFLEKYYPEALLKPCCVPIESIAKEQMGMNLLYECLSEEKDILGMTVFSDGYIDLYNPTELIYEQQFFKSKTILIDPNTYGANVGARNNTIAHECIHWFKHRLYYKQQNNVLKKVAKICKCNINPIFNEEEFIMEQQAIGIAPKILMPKNSFTTLAEEYIRINNGLDSNVEAQLAAFFQVSKQSVGIRIKECGIK